VQPQPIRVNPPRQGCPTTNDRSRLPRQGRLTTSYHLDLQPVSGPACAQVDVPVGSAVDGGSMAVSASTSNATTLEVLDISNVPTTTRPRTLLQDNRVKPKKFTDGTVRYDKLGMISTREPNSLQDALSDDHWKKAMDEEFSALKRNKIGHLVLAHCV
jgi:hypothetical protein